MSKSFTKFAILVAFWISLAYANPSRLDKRAHGIGERDRVNCIVSRNPYIGNVFTGKDALMALNRAKEVLGNPESVTAESLGLSEPRSLGFPKDIGYENNHFLGNPGPYYIYPMVKGHTWPEKDEFTSSVRILFDKNFEIITAVMYANNEYRPCEIVRR